MNPHPADGSIIQVKTAVPYQVVINSGILKQTGEFLKEFAPQKAAVIADRRAAELYGGRVSNSLKAAGIADCIYTFTPGEAAKNLTVLGDILNFLAENRLTRSDFVIALGGGVAGDLAGFAAAVYLRGIAFVQLPTTLLAMVDASIGGKSAVNLPAGKNLAGAFHQPRLVLCDTGTLATLPATEIANGTAEIIKTAMLSSVENFSLLAAGGISPTAPEIIRDCVEFKSRLVAADEFDRGERQLLNFGHTIGHALEQAVSYRITHGEAIAIGMMTATRAAAAAGITDEETCRQLRELLLANHLPVTSPLPQAELMPFLTNDKKRSGGRLTLIVPERPGKCRRETMTLTEAETFLRRGLSGDGK